jgi:membrane protein required for beta-lactamase induction
VWAVVRAVADWWDAVELWLTQLPFGFQVLLATVVLVPLCWGTAVVADRVVDVAAVRIAARRAARHD